MTDNDNHSETRSDGSSGSSGSSRRRGRRRSRRRSQSGHSSQTGQNTQAKQTTTSSGSTGGGGQTGGQTGAPGDTTGTADGGGKPKSGSSKRNRSRRRSSRGGKAKQGNNTKQSSAGSQTTNSRSSKNRRGGKNRRSATTRPRHTQHTQASRNRAQEHSRMVTRDETSAGGLVVSGLAEAVGPDGGVDLSRIYVALIGRLDRRGRLLWSMPKGHVEPGEDRSATAEREVWEETGVHGSVIDELGVIDYWFVSEGVRIHKTVHHHLLRYEDGDLNDEDPEVTEVAWIPASELIEHLAYADERKLARIAHDRLPDLARKERTEGRLTPR